MSYAEIGQVVTGATGLLLLGFAGYGLANLRYRVPGTAFFVALTLAGALWCFGYAFEKAQVTVDGFMLAARIEYLGLAFLPGLWLLVALSWMEHPLARSKVLRVVVFVLGGLLVLAVWTNEAHRWYYREIVPTGRTGFARYLPGILYYPLFTVLASSFAWSAILLLTHRKKVPLFRHKAVVILSANLFPPAFAIAFQLGFRPGGLDPTLFSLVPSFTILALGIFRHDFIRIVPIAREIVVESMEHPVLVLDPTGRLVDHNGAARDHLDGFLTALGADGGTQGEIQVGSGADLRSYRFRRSPVRGPGEAVQGTVYLLTDITEEQRLVERLSHQASHDALTGVPNRRHFEDHALGEITRAARHGGTMALVLFDLDHFKAINDRYGHPAGDRVLRAVVATITPRLRTYDQIARIGGEEFAVLMPETNPVEAREACERWRAALEATPQVIPGAVLTVTASFGVATLNDLPLTLPAAPRTRLDALMGLADRALYQAKNEGRNRVV